MRSGIEKWIREHVADNAPPEQEVSGWDRLGSVGTDGQGDDKGGAR